MNKTLTREQAIEVTTAVMKVVTSEIDIPTEALDEVVDLVSQTVVRTLLECGVRLPWFKERSN
jgi:hypothetical protein